MASRTKQKEEARARRLAEERARAERAARQRRLQMLGGVVIAAIAVVAVAIAVSLSGSSSKSGLQTGAARTQTVASVSQLLAGIPQSGATLGNPKAPVTMTYFGDLQCPICKDFTLIGGFPQLVQNEVRTGKVKVVYKGFETATANPATFQTQQVAALAAGAQGKFWDYTELFYHEQGQEGANYVSQTYLDALAAQVPGLNVSAWRAARTNNQNLVSQVSVEEQAGHSLGVSGTPTLIFNGPKGATEASSAVPSYSELQASIRKVS